MASLFLFAHWMGHAVWNETHQCNAAVCRSRCRRSHRAWSPCRPGWEVEYSWRIPPIGRWSSGPLWNHSLEFQGHHKTWLQAATRQFRHGKMMRKKGNFALTSTLLGQQARWGMGSFKRDVHGVFTNFCCISVLHGCYPSVYLRKHCGNMPLQVPFATQVRTAGKESSYPGEQL